MEMDAKKYRATARLCRIIARTQHPHVAKLTRRMADDFDRTADRLDPRGASWIQRQLLFLHRVVGTSRLTTVRQA